MASDPQVLGALAKQKRDSKDDHPAEEKIGPPANPRLPHRIRGGRADPAIVGDHGRDVQYHISMWKATALCPDSRGRTGGRAVVCRNAE